MEQEILSVFSALRIIKPDDVRGDYATLEEAVLAHQWPKLSSAKGKIVLVLDEGGKKREAYIKGHPSLKNRLMFVPASPGQAEAGFLIAKKDYERYTKLYQQNSASQKEYDDITTRYKVSQSQVEAAKQVQNEIDAMLSYSNIKAPF